MVLWWFLISFLYGVVGASYVIISRIFTFVAKKIHVQAEIVSKNINFLNVFCIIFS